MIENIVYSDDFDMFLASLEESRVSIIRDTLIRFAKGELDLDPRDCDHYKDKKRVKILLEDADVVVYYDLEGNDMIMIGGTKMKERVA